MTLFVLATGAYAVVSVFDVTALLERLRSADRRLLVLAGVVAAIGWPLRGWRYRAILRGMDAQLGIGFLTLAVVMSQTANLVVPARAGDGVRAVLLKDRADVPIATGIASVLVERLFDILVVLLLLAGGVLGLTARGVEMGVGVSRRGAALAATLGVITLGLMIVSPAPRWQGLRWPDWVPPAIRGWTESFGRALDAIRRRPRVLGWVTMSSVFVWGVDVLVGGVVAIAVLGSLGPLAGGIGLAAITVAVAGGNLAKSVPLTQGGIGIYEPVVAGVLIVSVSISAEVALTIAVLDHAVKNAVTVLGGVGGSIWMHLESPLREIRSSR